MLTIRDITPTDLAACAELLIDAYNCDPWNNHWTMETATRYLNEFLAVERFQGFLLEEDGKAVGASFCHSRTWWTGDEVYVDEFYIANNHQRRGLGASMMAAIEAYVKELGVNGITLLTDRNFPAMDFYRKNCFHEAPNVVFLYKVIKQ